MPLARIGTLLSASITGAGVVLGPLDRSGATSFQATVTGTGTVTATVLLQASNDTANWVTVATFTLSGTTSDTAGVTSTDHFAYLRGNITALTGTNAIATLVGST